MTTEQRQGAARELVERVLARHHDELLRVARRHSLCEDDAADAVQRALELFLRHAGRLDPERAHRWLFTVTKREAMAVRAERQRMLPSGAPYDFDAREARHDPSPDEHLLDRERVTRTAEALRGLKPAEVQALWLKASGASYEEIARDLGWTRTKVNRNLAEGRARLRARIAGIETGAECVRLAPVLETLAASPAHADDLVAARRHVRNCPGCRATLREAHRPRERGMLGVLPVGVLGLWGALQERAIGGAVRAQTAVETLAGGKAAAVAASAAALAGGGAVAVERAVEPPGRAQLQQVRTAPAAPQPDRRVPASGVLTSGRTTGVRAAVTPTATQRDPAPARTGSTAASTPVATPTPQTSAGEFGPDGASGAATAVAPAPPSPPRRAAAPPVAPRPADADLLP